MEITTDAKIISYIKRKIKDSHNIVAVLGIEMLVEGGGCDLDSKSRITASRRSMDSAQRICSQRAFSTRR